MLRQDLSREGRGTPSKRSSAIVAAFWGRKNPELGESSWEGTMGIHKPQENKKLYSTTSSRNKNHPKNNPSTWRTIPFSKELVTTIYKPFRPFGRGTTLLRGLTNHGYYPLKLTGMILQAMSITNGSKTGPRVPNG